MDRYGRRRRDDPSHDARHAYVGADKQAEAAILSIEHAIVDARSVDSVLSISILKS